MTRHIVHGRGTKEFQDFFTPPTIAAKLAQYLIDKADPAITTTVLDPAVGSGNLIWPLLASSKPFKVYCLDIQQDYLEYAAKEAKRLGYTVSTEPFGLSISNR